MKRANPFDSAFTKPSQKIKGFPGISNNALPPGPMEDFSDQFDKEFPLKKFLIAKWVMDSKAEEEEKKLEDQLFNERILELFQSSHQNQRPIEPGFVSPFIENIKCNSKEVDPKPQIDPGFFSFPKRTLKNRMERLQALQNELSTISSCFFAFIVLLHCWLDRKEERRNPKGFTGRSDPSRGPEADSNDESQLFERVRGAFGQKDSPCLSVHDQAP